MRGLRRIRFGDKRHQKYLDSLSKEDKEYLEIYET
jgi:hypothetical protein